MYICIPPIESIANRPIETKQAMSAMMCLSFLIGPEPLIASYVKYMKLNAYIMSASMCRIHAIESRYVQIAMVLHSVDYKVKSSSGPKDKKLCNGSECVDDKDCIC